MTNQFHISAVMTLDVANLQPQCVISSANFIKFTTESALKCTEFWIAGANSRLGFL